MDMQRNEGGFRASVEKQNAKCKMQNAKKNKSLKKLILRKNIPQIQI
jgi:hypothetical protein